jgi:hypothetical protein
MHQKRDDGANQKYDEQDLRDTCGTRRDAAEAKHGSDECNDEKHNGVVKHGIPFDER